MNESAASEPVRITDFKMKYLRINESNAERVMFAFDVVEFTLTN